MNWEIKQLEELADIIDSLHQTPKYSEVGLPMVRVTEIKGGYLNLENTFKVEEKVFEEFSKKHKSQKGDIVMSRVGTYGISSYVAHDTPFCLGQNTLFILPKIDNKFLYYSLITPNTKSQIEGFATGASQKTISLKSIKGIKILTPIPSTQGKIASILSAYDDLIENNLKRIKLLEEKAFVAYKLIVNTEKLSKVKLSEVAILNEETLKANSNLDKLLYVDISSVSTGSIDNKTEYELKGAPGRAKRILKHQDIIWSCVRPNRKSYSFVWRPEENLIASTGFAVITAKTIPATFLYQLITTNEFVNFLENHAKGATYPAVTASDFEEATIQIASDSVMKEYNEETYQCFELKNILQKQNTKLREARDILLPKLMSGQIEV
jgi:type I restriction enzyme S subunit